MLELALYGGAVFTLVYSSRETTKDVDAIIKPADAGQRLVKVVAAEQNLPDDWLNGEVQQFLSPHDQRRPFPSKEFEPGLAKSLTSSHTEWSAACFPKFQKNLLFNEPASTKSG